MPLHWSRSCWPMVNAASSTGDHVDLYIPSATTDYARVVIAVSSTDAHVDTSTTTDARMEIVVPSTGALNFDYHRLLAWRSSFQRPATLTKATTDYSHGDRRFTTGDHVDLVYLWRPPTTPNAVPPIGNHVDNIASSTDDHVDLCIPSTTIGYARLVIVVS